MSELVDNPFNEEFGRIHAYLIVHTECSSPYLQESSMLFLEKQVAKASIQLSTLNRGTKNS